jgi:hypothetical protein
MAVAAPLANHTSPYKQNIFAKSGTLILQERMKVTPLLINGTRDKKISKWVCSANVM